MVENTTSERKLGSPGAAVWRGKSGTGTKQPKEIKAGCGWGGILK